MLKPVLSGGDPWGSGLSCLQLAILSVSHLLEALLGLFLENTPWMVHWRTSGLSPWLLSLWSLRRQAKAASLCLAVSKASGMGSLLYLFSHLCAVQYMYISLHSSQARRNREIAILQRKIDEVPSRAELTQYQKRFIELYSQGNFLLFICFDQCCCCVQVTNEPHKNQEL